MSPSTESTTSPPSAADATAGGGGDQSPGGGGAVFGSHLSERVKPLPPVWYTIAIVNSC